MHPKRVEVAGLRAQVVPEEVVSQVVDAQVVVGLQVAADLAADVKPSSTQILTRKSTNHGSMRNTKRKGTS